MKKIKAIIIVLMFFSSLNVFAQEVGGIETRRVIYEGSLEYEYLTASYTYRDYYGKSKNHYGWEFTNFNSCAVSVDITLYKQAYFDDYNKIQIPAQIIATKSIVLQPEESYIFKHEMYDTEATEAYGKVKGTYNVDKYYVVYKAFKLQ